MRLDNAKNVCLVHWGGRQEVGKHDRNGLFFGNRFRKASECCALYDQSGQSRLLQVMFQPPAASRNKHIQAKILHLLSMDAVAKAAPFLESLTKKRRGSFVSPCPQEFLIIPLGTYEGIPLCWESRGLMKLCKKL